MQIFIILHILRKPNSIIALLFIQNNCKFKNEVKHAYLRRYQVHIDSASLSGSLGDEELFRYANILQIADVVRRVVFLLFLAMFLDNSSP